MVTINDLIRTYQALPQDELEEDPFLDAVNKVKKFMETHMKMEDDLIQHQNMIHSLEDIIRDNDISPLDLKQQLITPLVCLENNTQRIFEDEERLDCLNLRNPIKPMANYENIDPNIFKSDKSASDKEQQEHKEEISTLNREISELKLKIETIIEFQTTNDTHQSEKKIQRHPLEDQITINTFSPSVGDLGIKVLFESENWTLTGTQLIDKKITNSEDEESAAKSVYDAIKRRFSVAGPYLRLTKGSIKRRIKPAIGLNLSPKE